MSEIRCLCLDVDGVLTDGRVSIDEEGRPLRAFHIRDGLAIRWFQRLGGTVVFLTGKESRGLEHRAEELDVEHVIQGSEDKLGDLTKYLDDTLRISLQETAMIGDDLPDLPVLERCGYPIAVADAAAEVRHAARFVTSLGGGYGAVREAIEHLLKIAGRWNEVVEHYRTAETAAADSPETEAGK